MSTPIVRFFLSIFKHTWLVVAGGTLFGLSGLFSLFKYLPNLTGKKIEPRYHWAVLFCIFWFVCTYVVWKETDGNLQQVTQQIQEDNKNFNRCSADLQTQKAVTGLWHDRFSDEQKSLAALLVPQRLQQSTINRCVVSLGNMNPRISTIISVAAIYVDTEVKIGPPPRKNYFAIVISTNHRAIPEGILRCSKPFRFMRSPRITGRNGGSTGSPAIEEISNSEYRLRIVEDTVYWDTTTPIYMTAYTDDDSMSCNFTLQQ